MIEGLIRIPLLRFEDERGWFTELMRAGALPKPVRQSNLVFSRRGVVRFGSTLSRRSSMNQPRSSSKRRSGIRRTPSIMRAC